MLFTGTSVSVYLDTLLRRYCVLMHVKASVCSPLKHRTAVSEPVLVFRGAACG